MNSGSATASEAPESCSLASVLPQRHPHDSVAAKFHAAERDLPDEVANFVARGGITSSESVRLGLAAWATTLARCTGANQIDVGHVISTGLAVHRVRIPSAEGAKRWINGLFDRDGESHPRQGGSPETAWVDTWARQSMAATVEAGFFNDKAIRVQCDAEIFAPTAAAALADTLVHLIAEIVRHPETAVSTLCALAPSELLRLSQHAQRLARNYDVRPTVTERIEAQARSRPESPAVTCGDRTLAYRELNSRANQLARRLRGMGVGEGSLVAIGMGRSLDIVVGLLAILKSGGAYLPLDMAYPQDRLEFTMTDAAASVLITDRASAGALPPHQAAVILIDEHWESISHEDISDLDVQHSPESLAYLIYTSGSTGKPKGCRVTHANVMRLFTATEHWFGFSADDVWTFFHSHAFDFSVWEIWGALIYGGRVVVVPYVVSRSPSSFHELLCREGVTILNQTPTAFRALIHADREVPDSTNRLALRTVIFGGEALELQMLRPWFAKHGDSKPRLINMYGITETTVHVTYRPIGLVDLEANMGSVIGEPIPDLCTFLLNPRLEPVPVSVTGEIYVAGPGVSLGYLNREQLTAERFIHWTAPDGNILRLYKTGDLARWLPNGDIEYLGRADHQVKIRGFRIETGEIESVLMRHPQVQACAVIARIGDDGEASLVAYVVPSQVGLDQAGLRDHLAVDLPSFMLPSAYVVLQELPMTENGKLDRRALPAPASQRPDLAQPFQEPRDEAERRICDAFAQVLGLDRVGRLDNFFELGGNSMRVLKVLGLLQREGEERLSTNLFFQQPTPQALAAALTGVPGQPGFDARRLSQRASKHVKNDQEPIAIIAMAGRFPGARDVEQFWQNLCDGRDTITHFQAAELDASLAASLINDPCYVKARGVVDDVEMFDAAFFGITPREAELMDPQQRIFLELCWECLERAGHAPDACAGPVGVFAGMNNATYYQRHVVHHPDMIEKLGEFQVMLANEKDFIATRVAHRLNLTGPAISVHTACSTSLVAIAQAFSSLRAGQCDMALAGAASITCPPHSGYLAQEGAMLSPDGRTRSFDLQAQGTVFSDGAAVVLLKRLSDALVDGDPVYAVIRGVAVNNDGRDKASFTAPSVDGQAAVIAAAQAAAGIDPRSISYVEAHGTATPMGDPVEIEGLKRAFRQHTSDTGFCRIGSVKSNVGHLVIAAGAAGTIKTVLALAHEQIPASIHFDRPNPKIDFSDCPFVVNDKLSAWPRNAEPRRAGVSSFGVGGTNAHVILEEAPLREPSTPSAGPQLLQLSARSRPALDTMVKQLADHLGAHPELNLADVAHTLQVGRTRFSHRLCVVAESGVAAAQALRLTDHPHRTMRSLGQEPPGLVWLFPGQGAQYVGMGKSLYEQDPAFRQAFEECLSAFGSALDFDLRARMFQGGADALAATGTTQPATFCIEYALAQSWLARGARPVALIGHSVGEFVAAVLAQVMSLADATRLVARRGALMQALPAGGMLSLRASAEKVLESLPAGLSLAAENSPLACVVAGPISLLDAYATSLESSDIAVRRLQTSHAFHSSMMDAVVAPFRLEVGKVKLSAPRIALISTLTGKGLDAAQATDPNYWARHLRDTVRFSSALRFALQHHDAAFLEVGPRATLSALARQHTSAGKAAPIAISSLGDRVETETTQLALAQGQLWTLGIDLPVSCSSPSIGRRRVLLPGVAFERKRFWVEAPLPVARPSPPLHTASNANSAAVQTPVVVSTVPSPASATMTTIPSSAAAANRTPQLVSQLRTLFEDVAGLDLGEADPGRNFVELGLDSLTLTQAALQVKKQFKVAITFRQMMEKYRSLDTLASYLDATLPADKPAMSASAAAIAMPAAPLAQSLRAADAAGVMSMASLPVMQAPVGGGVIQQLIQQQMLLMAQQLALLGGAGVAPAAIQAAPQTAMPTVAHEPTPVAALPTAAANTPPATEEAGVMRYDVKKAFGAIARIHTQASTLNERQRARLDAFMRRYLERTPRSKAYTVEHRPHLADPRVVNGFRPMTKEIVYQIVVERSKGSRMWDIDGNEYVDVLNGFGMNLLGWQPDFINDAVRKQLDAGYDIGPQHPLAGEVAKLLCELTGFDRVGLCNTGSEAVMAAVRIARTVTGRSTIVVFTGSYHGTFDEVLVRAGRGAKGIPAAPGIMSGMFGDIRVLDYGTPESLEFIRANAEDLAAVLVEPVQSRRPDFQPREFLKEVRGITERSGTCLIFDEVITGFRSHLGGTQALFGIRADIACYGKVIGGGFPVGAVAGKVEYMDSLDGGAWQYGDDSIPTVGVTYFAGTFVRHPLALAAAKASLEHFRAQGHDLQTQLNLSTAAMANELTAFCRESGAPIEIHYFSSLWRVSWLEDHPLQDLLFAMMRSRGVHILDNFPCFMTTAHTPSDIATIKSAFKESVAELQEADFLPRRAKPSELVDPSRPPVPNAKLGRDKEGRPAWFVPDNNAPGKYVRVNVQ